MLYFYFFQVEVHSRLEASVHKALDGKERSSCLLVGCTVYSGSDGFRAELPKGWMSRNALDTGYMHWMCEYGRHWLLYFITQSVRECCGGWWQVCRPRFEFLCLVMAVRDQCRDFFVPCDGGHWSVRATVIGQSGPHSWPFRARVESSLQ